MKTILTLAAGLAAGFTLISVTVPAQAGPVRVGVDIGIPYQGPAYVPAQPVYVEPPPVYVQGGPVYVDGYWHGGWHDRRWVEPQWRGGYYGRAGYYGHYDHYDRGYRDQGRGEYRGGGQGRGDHGGYGERR
jgi:hypothetical protein